MLEDFVVDGGVHVVVDEFVRQPPLPGLPVLESFCQARKGVGRRRQAFMDDTNRIVEKETEKDGHEKELPGVKEVHTLLNRGKKGSSSSPLSSIFGA